MDLISGTPSLFGRFGGTAVPYSPGNYAPTTSAGLDPPSNAGGSGGILSGAWDAIKSDPIFRSDAPKIGPFTLPQVSGYLTRFGIEIIGGILLAFALLMLALRGGEAARNSEAGRAVAAVVK